MSSGDCAPFCATSVSGSSAIATGITSRHTRAVLRGVMPVVLLRSRGGCEDYTRDLRGSRRTHLSRNCRTQATDHTDNTDAARLRPPLAVFASRRRLLRLAVGG